MLTSKATILAALAIAAGLAAPCDAESAWPRVAAYGLGNLTCAEYASVRDRASRDLLISWAQGFISGTNSRCPLKQTTGQISNETIISFLNSSCAGDPLKTVSEVIDAMTIRLSEIRLVEECSDPSAAAALTRSKPQ